MEGWEAGTGAAEPIPRQTGFNQDREREKKKRERMRKREGERERERKALLWRLLCTSPEAVVLFTSFPASVHLCIY